jgi:macrolide transport system ATP-binding/permease protein
MKAREKAKRVEEYWAQQEEIWELRRIIKGKARQVAHNRPPRDGDKFLAYFKSERVATAIARNVHAAEEKLRRLEENPIPKPPTPLSLNPDFRPQDLVSRSPLIATGISKCYGERAVLDGIDLSLSPGTRAILVGPNGAGKSTLLRILAGIEKPDDGQIETAASVSVGYLDQEQETLPAEGTLFEVYRNGRIGEWEEIKAELLRYGLFIYPDLLKPVTTLSVGQKRKLQIARLIAAKANLLLLDEPTNHISFDVLEEVEAALLAFPGPILAASHDRRFIRRFANEIWHLRAGKLRRYLGGWEEYERVAAQLN